MPRGPRTIQIVVRDPRDIVDIPGVTLPKAPGGGGRDGAGSRNPNAWLGIWFRCCHVYGRLYKNRTGRAYVGRCPRCGGEVSARVGDGGTTRRFFEAQ